MAPLDSAQSGKKQGQVKRDHMNKGRIKQDYQQNGHTKQSQMKQRDKASVLSQSRRLAKPTPLVAQRPAANEPSYRVQLASYRTERAAVKGQVLLKKMLGDRAVDLDILVKRSKNDGPSAFNYQIRTGPIKTRTQGVGLCKTLKKAGHRGCLVVEHNDLLWKNLAKAGEHHKASLDRPQGRTRQVVSNADAALTIIALPSSIVMEAGHTISTGSSGTGVAPSIPGLGKLARPLVDI